MPGGGVCQASVFEGFVCAAQIALKTNQQGVLYFTDKVTLGPLLEEDGKIDGTCKDTSLHVPSRRCTLALITSCSALHRELF